MELLIFILFILFMFARAVIQQQRRQAERSSRQGRREAVPPEAPEESPWPWWEEPLPPMWPQDLGPSLEPSAPEPVPAGGTPPRGQVPLVVDEPERQAGAGRKEAPPRPSFGESRSSARALFLDLPDVRRAVIMAEILAPPLSRRRTWRYRL